MMKCRKESELKQLLGFPETGKERKRLTLGESISKQIAPSGQINFEMGRNYDQGSLIAMM